jgi:hypothetical protein
VEITALGSEPASSNDVEHGAYRTIADLGAIFCVLTDHAAKFVPRHFPIRIQVLICTIRIFFALVIVVIAVLISPVSVSFTLALFAWWRQSCCTML